MEEHFEDGYTIPLSVLWGGPIVLQRVRLALFISNKSVISNNFHAFMVKILEITFFFCIELIEKLFSEG